MKNLYIAVSFAVFLVGGSAFYGGMKYGESRVVSTFQGLRNLSPEEKQARLSQFGAGAGMFRMRQGGGSVNGEIISKDDKSLTVKLRDGGSRIIFFSDSTEIVKAVNGSKDDLQAGKTIFVTGSANSDGSITAQNIQLRSQMK